MGGRIYGTSSLNPVIMLFMNTLNLQRHLFFLIRCDGIEPMKQALPRLRDRLGNDSDYFKSVYNHTFDFARSEGQRSLGEFSLFTKISFSQFALMLSDISSFLSCC